MQPYQLASRAFDRVGEWLNESGRAWLDASVYQLEASYLQKARSLFRDEDGIIVPRVYESLSTGRVLTMDFVAGAHLD